MGRQVVKDEGEGDGWGEDEEFGEEWGEGISGDIGECVMWLDEANIGWGVSMGLI